MTKKEVYSWVLPAVISVFIIIATYVDSRWTFTDFNIKALETPTGVKFATYVEPLTKGKTKSIGLLIYTDDKLTRHSCKMLTGESQSYCVAYDANLVDYCVIHTNDEVEGKVMGALTCYLNDGNEGVVGE